MRRRTLLLIASVAMIGACAQIRESPETDAYAARMSEAGDGYSACVMAEVEKDAKSPASVENMAVAAHGRCWEQWDAYRQATRASFTLNARTHDEKQFANDKADAHLRQFELDTRHSVMDSAIERSRSTKGQP